MHPALFALVIFSIGSCILPQPPYAMILLVTLPV
jgi:hypothetical protein